MDPRSEVVLRQQDYLNGQVLLINAPNDQLAKNLPSQVQASVWTWNYADHRYIDLIEERIDIAIRMSLRVDDHHATAVPLARVDQVLVASPSYLNQAPPITRPEDLRHHELLPVTLMQNYQHFAEM